MNGEKNGSMKFNLGHIIIIITMLVSLGVSWGAFTSKIDSIEMMLSEKADRQVVEIQLAHINESLKRIEKKLGE